MHDQHPLHAGRALAVVADGDGLLVCLEMSRLRST